MVWRPLTIALAGILFVAAGTTIAFGHGGATGIVKERMELMKSIGGSMKTLAAMFKGGRAYDSEAVRAAATDIRANAGEHMTRFFPEDSLDDPSEALPSIWTQWAEFDALAGQLAAYSDALAAAAENPRQAGTDVVAANGTDKQALQAMPPDALFLALARTCSGCHTKFREKK